MIAVGRSRAPHLHPQIQPPKETEGRILNANPRDSYARDVLQELHESILLSKVQPV